MRHVLIVGSLCILYSGLNVLGKGALLEGWRTTIAAAGDNIHLIRSLRDPDWSWAAVLPGSAIIGCWYWCTDQYIVLRVLAGRNQQQSRRGAILAAYLKLIPAFIFLVPGMIAFALTRAPTVGTLGYGYSISAAPAPRTSTPHARLSSVPHTFAYTE